MRPRKRKGNYILNYRVHALSVLICVNYAAFLKLPSRILFAVAMATGIVLFGSDSFIDHLGLMSARDEYRAWLGWLCLLSTSVVIAHGLFVGVPAAWRWGRHRWNMRRLRHRLHALTEEEKNILRFYISNQTRAQDLDFTDGVVARLEAGLGTILTRTLNWSGWTRKSESSGGLKASHSRSRNRDSGLLTRDFMVLLPK